MKIYLDLGVCVSVLEIGNDSIQSKLTEQEIIEKMNADMEEYLNSLGITEIVESLGGDIKDVKAITKEEYDELSEEDEEGDFFEESDDECF